MSIMIRAFVYCDYKSCRRETEAQVKPDLSGGNGIRFSEVVFFVEPNPTLKDPLGRFSRRPTGWTYDPLTGVSLCRKHSELKNAGAPQP